MQIVNLSDTDPYEIRKSMDKIYKELDNYNWNKASIEDIKKLINATNYFISAYGRFAKLPIEEINDERDNIRTYYLPDKSIKLQNATGLKSQFDKYYLWTIDLMDKQNLRLKLHKKIITTPILEEKKFITYDKDKNTG
jgi:hypothetical protein